MATSRRRESSPPIAAENNVVDLEIIERIVLFKSRDFKVSGNPCEIKDQPPNIHPLSIALELDHENLVRDNVFPEEVEVEGTNNVMNAHMLNTEEGGEEDDDVIPNVDDDNNGFTSSSSENESDENVR
ncbi:Glycogen synthase [Forsythia ovata]|uniref:Glycogen synthase n=1 Tax=Forsythia ovata TaxID=205694 RepID=A0ABD1UWV1_9LAMI